MQDDIREVYLSAELVEEVHIRPQMELSVYPKAMFTVCAGLCMDFRRQDGASIATLTTNSLRLVSNNYRRRVVYTYKRINAR